MAEDYKPNSHLAREQQAAEHPPIAEKRVQKVVTGEVSQRKKSGLSEAANSFLSSDVNSVKRYILMDVLVPSIKRAISDIVCNGINMLLGEPNRSKNASAGSKVSYRQYYQDDRRDYARPRTQSQYSYDDIVFKNRGDAEEVLYRMEELLERFEVVSVADLFDMAGVSCNYTDNKYGWTDLRDAYVKRVSDGYIISLPRATTL